MSFWLLSTIQWSDIIKPITLGSETKRLVQIKMYVIEKDHFKGPIVDWSHEMLVLFVQGSCKDLLPFFPPTLLFSQGCLSICSSWGKWPETARPSRAPSAEWLFGWWDTKSTWWRRRSQLEVWSRRRPEVSCTFLDKNKKNHTGVVLSLPI